MSKLDQSDIAKMAIGMEDRGNKFYTAAEETAEKMHLVELRSEGEALIKKK